MGVIEKAGENARCPGDANRPAGPPARFSLPALPAQKAEPPTIRPDGHPNCGVAKHVTVKIPADLACKGVACWKQGYIDSCLAPLVKSLQEGGVDMRGSCCGHGKYFGEIVLQDGNLLLVLSPLQAREYTVGQVVGKRWVLRLEEAPLDTPDTTG